MSVLEVDAFVAGPKHRERAHGPAPLRIRQPVSPFTSVALRKPQRKPGNGLGPVGTSFCPCPFSLRGVFLCRRQPSPEGPRGKRRCSESNPGHATAPRKPKEHALCLRGTVTSHTGACPPISDRSPRGAGQRVHCPCPAGVLVMTAAVVTPRLTDEGSRLWGTGLWSLAGVSKTHAAILFVTDGNLGLD